MVLMLLDHCRDFFHFSSITLEMNPLNPEQSSTPIYLTRWITHLCAPTFVALAGISIFLQKEKAKSNPEFSLPVFLFTRGLWLIFLELTIVNFSWQFYPPILSGFIQVIGAIGICMVCMSALIQIPWSWAFAIGIAFTLTHNLFDTFKPEPIGFTGKLWAILHGGGPIKFGQYLLYIAYPFVPWLGIMLLGYGAGPLFSAGSNSEKRQKTLVAFSIIFLFLFAILRSVNSVGDPKPWKSELWSHSFWFQFFDVQKYPPSLLYSLITLGIGCFLLLVMEKIRIPFRRLFLVFGRVPFFYYIIHLYFIHSVAILAFIMQGGKWQDLKFGESFGGLPPGSGFSLAGVYFFWLLSILILFPVCSWYEKYKSANKHNKWLSYI